MKNDLLIKGQNSNTNALVTIGIHNVPVTTARQFKAFASQLGLTHAKALDVLTNMGIHEAKKQKGNEKD